MLLLSEYNFLEKISFNGNSFLYRAERCSDRQKVIIKIFEDSGSGSAEAARITNEFEIASSFSFRGIARHLKLETYHNRHVAVIEDREGVSLEKYLQNHKTNIESSLRIAVSITEILEYFYQKGVVHQDLCPAHVLVNPRTLEVSLIDFSLASRVSAQNRTVEQPCFLKGSLAYMSPEQTGRIKGEIDIRSDLYSLGAMLYELVTGSVPFKATEALALIHCHIAKSPLPPHVSNPRVPIALSSIILKLLAKNAEDRYQSPFGLKADLQACLAQWASGGRIDLGELGRHDFSGRLQTPKKFYGREKETSTLLQAFKRVSAGAVETVLIEGYSGIGKSALAHQIKDSVHLQGGIFVDGKFNQFQRNIPYVAFIQAFKAFTDFILAQSPGRIAVWKERILKAVGVNGRVLTDIIPHLELLIGSQPTVPELGPNETQNRLHYVFINFIKCVSQKDHPLIIFFDDLQWADAASSNLVKIILTDQDLQFFLFIGAYRENEMTDGCLFSATAADMQKEGCPVQKLTVSPLPRQNVEELIRETLACAVQDGPSLVDVVYDKSQGNPFFINVFLKCLYAENILVFDFYTFNWTWDAPKINQLRFTENLVELMTGRIRKLPEATQELLKTAACLGYNFNVQLLSVVLQQTRQQIAEKLKPALDEDLVLPAGDSYRFTHDRIQQAAYSLIPDAEKKNEHLKIGNLLLQNLDSEAQNAYIFEIANQLNAGVESLISQEEKDRLAALNLSAGIKAKSSAAYQPSFEYLQTGICLLNPDAWENQYELALHLHIEGAESGFLAASNGLMEKWIEAVLQNASTVLDKVSVYEIRIKYFIAQNRLLEAVQTSLEILELLDVRFPKNPTKVHVLTALVRIRIALFRRPVDTLIDLPLIKSPYAEAAIRVLASVGSAVYFARPNLFPLFVCKAFSLMIKHGNTPYSEVVCASYGLIMIGGVGNINAGYHLGKLAGQLSEKFGVSSLKCQSRMMVNTFIVHWKEHIKNTLEPLLNNYWYGLENGNIEFASYSAFVYCHNAFFCGHDLKKVTDEDGKFYERLQRLRHESAFNLHRITAQAVLNLHEPVESPTILTGKLHNEEEMMPFYTETREETALFKVYLCKLLLSYFLEKYDEAQRNAQAARSRIKSFAGTTEVMIFYFYDTLTSLSLLPAHSGSSRKSLLQKVSHNLKLFKKFARLAPMNYSQKLSLLEAELCRITGRSEKAALLYDDAISKAKENEYLNDQALACELAGKFYQAQHREVIAQQYLLQAYRLYQQWAAFAKVRDMEQKYPFLMEQQQGTNPISAFSLNKAKTDSSAADSPAERGSEGLDLHSIMKAATAISSEIQLEKLLKKLVKIAVENAGAQRGYLLLKKDNGFFIEAEGSVEAEEEVVVQSVPMKGSEAVSEAIVQFVYVTQESLVIENAIQHPHFSSDPIIVKNGSKSLLCTPIIHQGDVIGLLYFENKLVTNAFTFDRIELLKLLSGQMAVSLQNALNEQKKINAFMEREKLLKKINLQQTVISKAILRTQENERKRIAEELHDGLGYMLSTLKLNLTSIKELSSPEEQNRFLYNSSVLLEDSFKELRYISNNLMPDLLFQFGLLVAVEDLCRKVNDTGKLSLTFKHYNLKKKLKKDFELEVFRIVQELINNTIKHAEAQHLEIQFLVQQDTLVITAEDDGKGFDFTKKMKSRNKGKGLTNITNRVNFLRGNMRVESSEGRGTTFIINLPFTFKLVNLQEDGKDTDCR